MFLLELSKAPRRTLAILVFIAAALIGLSVTGSVIAQDPLILSGELTNSEVTRSLVTMGFAGVLFATLMGAYVMTSESRNRTLGSTFLLNPNRREVLFAKALTSMVLGLGIGLVCNALAIGLAVLLLGQYGHTPAFSTDLWVMVAGSVLVTVIAGPWGLAVGTVARSSVAATSIVVIWSAMFEVALAAVAPSVSRFLPGEVQAAMAQLTDHGDALGRLPAILLFLGYLLGASWAAHRVVQTREVRPST